MGVDKTSDNGVRRVARTLSFQRPRSDRPCQRKPSLKLLGPTAPPLCPKCLGFTRYLSFAVNNPICHNLDEKVQLGSRGMSNVVIVMKVENVFHSQLGI